MTVRTRSIILAAALAATSVGAAPCQESPALSAGSAQLAAASAPGALRLSPSRLAHTYSIVARDPATGELGVGVQSHWFSVGTSVAWAEAGVGAVATQSLVDPAYGPLGLELMRTGRSAPQALRSLLAGDDGAAVRQVAMVDAAGQVAAHTGSGCIAAAGHQLGAGYSVQANIMVDPDVWPAMAKAFESTPGDLAQRILAALEAAQTAGGDLRGRQSAALVIVAPQSTGRPWVDRRFDLRVEDHPTPILELRRLVGLQRAYTHMNRGDELMATGDIPGAVGAYGEAERLVPDNTEISFWHAVTLATANRVDDSLPIFARVFATDPNWAVLLPRLAHVGLFPDEPSLLERVLATAPAAKPRP